MPEEKFEKKKSLLAQALNDIVTKIGGLKGKKAELEQELENLVKSVTGTRIEERRLRNEITRLIEKETNYTEKKSDIQDQISKLTRTIAKINKIKEDLSEVGDELEPFKKGIVEPSEKKPNNKKKDILKSRIKSLEEQERIIKEKERALL